MIFSRMNPKLTRFNLLASKHTGVLHPSGLFPIQHVMDSMRAHPLNPSAPRFHSSADTPLAAARIAHSPVSGKIVITAFVILVIISIFVGACALSWRRNRRRIVVSRRRDQDRSSQGLDKSIIDSLPTFTYKTQLSNSSSVEAGPPECAVCLIDFQHNDACRLLPKCNHSFHTKCIDKWFVSNMTCPMCRTLAEMVYPENRYCSESMRACLLPYENLTEQTQRLDSSPHHEEMSIRALRLRSRSATCVLRNQDLTARLQRTRSISHFSREHDEGLGLNMRQILARTSSSKFNYVRYGMLGQERDNGTSSINAMRTNMPTNIDKAERDGQSDHHLRTDASKGVHLCLWQRSASERCLDKRQDSKYPTNFLFGGNELHTTSHLCKDHCQVGGRSLPHLSIEMSKLEDKVSLQGLSASSRPSLGLSTG